MVIKLHFYINNIFIFKEMEINIQNVNNNLSGYRTLTKIVNENTRPQITLKNEKYLYIFLHIISKIRYLK